LAVFSKRLEEAVIETVKKGFMTKDLALCVSGNKPVKRSDYQSTDEFMKKVSETFKNKMQNHAKL
jgi:isocitrate dehydrogenase